MIWIAGMGLMGGRKRAGFETLQLVLQTSDPILHLARGTKHLHLAISRSYKFLFEEVDLVFAVLYFAPAILSPSRSRKASSCECIPF